MTAAPSSAGGSLVLKKITNRGKGDEGRENTETEEQSKGEGYISGLDTRI